MENQHRKISGYRELSQTEVDLMNEIKAFGPYFEKLIEKIKAHHRAQDEVAWTRKHPENNDETGITPTGDPTEYDRLAKADPEKWLVFGEVQIQQGLMCLTRAIAQPTFF